MQISCFQAYDVRGEIGKNINPEICYRIGRAFAQHLSAKKIVLGYDARETSPEFSTAVSKGIRDAGADVLCIGLAGTEEMYWATTSLSACGGIEVTASHNPINYNGLKFVKAGSHPLSQKDFKAIRSMAQTAAFTEPDLLGKKKGYKKTG